MPSATGGVVGPKPVPHRMITSPGLAATVVAPGNVPSLTARLKSWRVATGWLFGHRKNAGPNCCDVTVDAELVPPSVLTVTAIGPVPTDPGTTALIWVGLMKLMYAALPPISTLTPLRLVGRAPFTIELVQSLVPPEVKFVPLMVNQDPGTSPG